MNIYLVTFEVPAYGSLWHIVRANNFTEAEKLCKNFGDGQHYNIYSIELISSKDATAPMVLRQLQFME